ncbi:MAG: hypothetical protein LBE91_08295, partial [Tannerella sp.]|nr:hypothetical protein [Tannerella sp.]
LCDEKEHIKRAAQILANREKREVQVIEIISSVEPETVIDSYESACKYLGMNFENLKFEIDSRYIKKIWAMYMLMVIAEAWNKQNKFVPDFTCITQCKFVPEFIYRKESQKYIFNDTTCRYNMVDSNLPFVFETSTRAKQFGEQFIDLWNDYLL